MNIEEILYNKDLCDALRDVTTNSVTTLDHAFLCLQESDDLQRDIFIIKKLSNRGIHPGTILQVMIALQDER